MLLAAAAPTVSWRMTAPPGRGWPWPKGPSAIVMDDGLQNPSLAKTLSLLVIDGGYGFGNRSAPARRAVARNGRRAAARCRAAVLIGEDETGALAAPAPFLAGACARIWCPTAGRSWRGGR